LVLERGDNGVLEAAVYERGIFLKEDGGERRRQGKR